MIFLSPSENGPFFKIKPRIRASDPAVVGRAHDPEIGRISHFQKKEYLLAWGYVGCQDLSDRLPSPRQHSDVKIYMPSIKN
jgi:hypothetical protein